MKGLEALVESGDVKRNVELGPLTTYKFGGPAAYLAEVGDIGELDRVIGALHQEQADLPVLALGRGSNLVISDDGFHGLVLRMGGSFLDVAIGDDGIVSAGAAVPLPKLARATVKACRGGLEFYVGIPGSVGGAVRMNAGCHGSETSEWLVDATVVDLRSGVSKARNVADLDLRYRHSSVTEAELVIGATYRTVSRPPEEGEKVLREVTQWRKQHQPGGTLNAGSVFKNPPGDSAGRIIDELGLKGFRIGGVSVSTRHANFFVADQGSRAQDVHDLVAVVRARIAGETGIWLEPEMKFAGHFDVGDESVPHGQVREETAGST